jgi:hypothetical protein
VADVRSMCSRFHTSVVSDRTVIGAAVKEWRRAQKVCESRLLESSERPRENRALKYRITFAYIPSVGGAKGQWVSGPGG